MESEVPEEKRVKQCPNCKTFVQYDYSVCPNCGHVFEVPKGERKSLRMPTPSPKSETPRTINIIQLLYFFFASYMLLNGISAISIGEIVAAIYSFILVAVEMFLWLATRKKLRIAYKAGLIVSFFIIGFFSLGLIATIIVPVAAEVIISVIIAAAGILGMNVIIIILLLREKDYFTESLSGKRELPVKESIPEIPAPSYQTEAAPAYKAESMNQVITTHLNAAKSSWKIAENAYKNAVWVEFILRADDAIQNLIKGRYMQLFGPIKPGMAVLPMVEAIRLRGYQLPESDEFEKWMTFREDVAKGTHSPEEMEVVKAYPFYRRILDILGVK
jgi:hypothetical protein